MEGQRFLTEKQMCQYLNASRTFVKKIGLESQCILKIGRAVRYDTELLQQYLDGKYLK